MDDERVDIHEDTGEDTAWSEQETTSLADGEQEQPTLTGMQSVQCAPEEEPEPDQFDGMMPQQYEPVPSPQGYP